MLYIGESEHSVDHPVCPLYSQVYSLLRYRTNALAFQRGLIPFPNDIRGCCFDTPDSTAEVRLVQPSFSLPSSLGMFSRYATAPLLILTVLRFKVLGEEVLILALRNLKIY